MPARSWTVSRDTQARRCSATGSPCGEQVGSKHGDDLFRRVSRRMRHSCTKRHDLREPRRTALFFSRGGRVRQVHKSWYLTETKTRLGSALQYFAGASPSNIMPICSVSVASMSLSVWGVIDVIHTTFSCRAWQSVALFSVAK